MATHSLYMRALLENGWLGVTALIAFILLTVWRGAMLVLTLRAKTSFLIAYASYLGVLVNSVVIDTLHWRHFFLVLGLVWGGILADYARQRVLRTGAAQIVRAVADGRRAGGRGRAMSEVPAIPGGREPPSSFPFSARRTTSTARWNRSTPSAATSTSSSSTTAASLRSAWIRARGSARRISSVWRGTVASKWR